MYYQRFNPPPPAPNVREMYASRPDKSRPLIISVVDANFLYTVGCVETLGYELLMTGVSGRSPEVQELVHRVHRRLCELRRTAPSELDHRLVIDGVAGVPPVPVFPARAVEDLDHLHEWYVSQADLFYGRRVDVVQIVGCDGHLRLPTEDGYDYDEYQRLFVDVDKMRKALRADLLEIG